MDHKALKLKRVELGLKQADIAERCDVTQALVSLWESGKKQMTITDVRNYCSALSVDFDSPTDTNKIVELIDSLPSEHRKIVGKIVDVFASEAVSL